MKALPGYALIEMESHFRATDLIELPEWVKRKPCQAGRVKHFALKRDERDLFSGEDINGRRVLVKAMTGVQITGNLYRVPCSSVEAVLPEDGTVEHVRDRTSQRCRFCGQARDSGQNMLMVDTDGLLYCPRCMRDEFGAPVDPISHAHKDPTDEEVRMLTPDYRAPTKATKVSVVRP